MVVLGVVVEHRSQVLPDNQEQTHYMVLLIMDLLAELDLELQHMQQVVEVVQVVQVEMLQIHLHRVQVDLVEHRQ